MTEKYKPYIITALVLVIAAGLYALTKRNVRREGEENEIKSTLEALYKAEARFFETNNHYTSGYEVTFDLPETKRPTLVGVFPDCSEPGIDISYTYIGPEDAAVKKATVAAMNTPALKDKCSNFKSGFLGFAAQNLDEDDNFEIWTVDQNNKKTVLVED